MNVAGLVAWGIMIGITAQGGYAMGDQMEQLVTPKYMPLEQGEELLEAVVRDENTTTELEWVSFFGSTSVGGICREDNDSITSIQLTNVKKLVIKQQDYASTRYPNKDFCLAEKTGVDGVVTEGLLIPRKVVVCGIEKKTKDEKAWFLGKIDQLEVIQPGPLSPAERDQTYAQKTQALQTAGAIEVQAAMPVQPELTPASMPVVQVTEEFENKKIVLQRQTGAMETKSILQAVNDLLVAIIGVVKAIFESIRGLFM